MEAFLQLANNAAWLIYSLLWQYCHCTHRKARLLNAGNAPYFTFIAVIFLFGSRERPAAIPIEIKSIDDTSNFDEFPESDILQPGEST